MLVALLVFMPASLARPGTAFAADGIDTSATSTYTLRPEAGAVDVSIDMNVTNYTENTVSWDVCTGLAWDPYYGYYDYTYACSTTTRYYVNSTSLILEHGITNLKITANSGTPKAKLSKGGEYFDLYAVSFANTFNGQTRKLHVSYRIPTGAPRSSSTTRVNAAFASFCVVSNGVDAGSVRVTAPSSFAMEVETEKGTFRSAASDGMTTWDTGALGDPLGFWGCFTGENAVGYKTSTFNSPTGRRIELQAWPNDPDWTTDLKRQVTESIGSIEKLVGRALPGTGTIAIREVASLGNYAGYFDPETNVARIGEDLGQDGVVAHEISHAWFNKSSFDGTWLSEGFAGWAESGITGDRCSEPSAPSGLKPNLSQWTYVGPRSTEAEIAAVGYEYDVSCYVVSAIADRMGPERMRDVIGALLDHKSAYRSGDHLLDAPPGPADWRTWVDAVDELGLVPAGARDMDFAQGLLTQFGVTTDAALLAARSSARAKYHALIDDVDGWTLPVAVLKPMAEWKFPAATEAITSAAHAHKAVVTTDELLPGVNALDGPVRDLFQDATTIADLRAAERTASDQAEAAGIVADAQNRFEAPRDLLAEVGLIGSDLHPALVAAVAAVTAADLPGAQASAIIVVDALAGAHDQGVIRLAVTSGVVALLLVLVFVLRQRRRATVTTVPERLSNQGATSTTEFLHAAAPSAPAAEEEIGEQGRDDRDHARSAQQDSGIPT